MPVTVGCKRGWMSGHVHIVTVCGCNSQEPSSANIYELAAITRLLLTSGAVSEPLIDSRLSLYCLHSSFFLYPLTPPSFLLLSDGFGNHQGGSS